MQSYKGFTHSNCPGMINLNNSYVEVNSTPVLSFGGGMVANDYPAGLRLCQTVWVCVLTGAIGLAS